MFKQTLMALGTAGVVVLGVVAPSLAGEQDFTILNNTGMSFTEVYVEASTNEDDWGENLAEDGLKANEDLEISFEGEEECKHDLMLVDSKGTKWTVEKLDLCKIHDFVITKKGNKLVWAAH